MAVFNEPTQWNHTLGNNADTSTLPDDAAATAGIASLQKLFQIINATPLEAGGIAPDREDVNALFKYLGDQIFYTQNGGIPSYNADYDYVPGRVVLYTDNNLYKCVQANGASSTVVAPGTDEAYWQQLDKPSSALLPNQLVISPVPMTDANLHLLDGALLSGSGAYSAYVAMMGALHDADPTATCWTDEATWQASITTYGECGKFVYDSVNNTLRLPKVVTYIMATNTATELGLLVEAGLPNITGILAGNADAKPKPSGAFFAGDTTDQCSVFATVGNYKPLQFDASRSNPIYSKSNTVQTQAIKYYHYIVVGTVSKTGIQIDIDNVMTDLALKANKDLTNATPTSAFATALNNAQIRTVIETYINGSSWYRVYSDGWCEQGGQVPSGADSDYTGTLIKPYSNTDYQIGFLGLANNSNTSTIQWQYIKIYPLTTSTFGCKQITFARKWFACGYIS